MAKKGKKKNNSMNSIYEKALLVKTPGYNIDENEVQYGRTHDKLRDDERCRHTRKPHRCSGDGCSLYFEMDSPKKK